MINTVQMTAMTEAIKAQKHQQVQRTAGNIHICVCRPQIRTDSTPRGLLGLADPVHSAYGLQLVSRVEDRLHQQHVSRLDDVQAVGAGVERKEEDVDLFFVFEGAQILLGN